MPFEDTKILKFNSGERSDKAAFIIYPDLDCLERTNECKKILKIIIDHPSFSHR